MNTVAAEQNTVFIVVERCETGAALAKARSEAVKAAKTIDEYFVVDGRAWKKYVKHLLACPECLAWEQSKGRML